VSEAFPRRLAPIPAEASAGSREEAGPAGCADLRCGCGNLLARRVAGGVELKCRRCKRTVVLPLADERDG
jgi:hypothetical protein